MNTKFTKGPWQINDRDPSQICDSDGDGRGCAPIANVRGTAAEQKANAALIASAPELYEALLDIVSADEEQALCKEHFDAARALLKKARGEA